MASAIQDIGDIAKKCKILLLDIEGTTTSISFVKDKLFPYAGENVQKFLETQWETDDVKEAVAGLRKLSLEDKEKNVDGVVLVPGEDASKEEQIEGLVKNVKWLMETDRKVGPLKLLQGLIWKQGYDNGDIKGHVYDDVAPALELWRSVEEQKVYIYSSGSVQAQKLLFGQSVAGDLLKHINGHFDTAVGAKQEAGSYAKIVEEIGCKAEDVVFLTDIVKEAEAARCSGMQTALVSRAGNAPLSEAGASYPVLHSLAQLAATNKRKPEDVQDEQSAKIPKTDIETDVKTNSKMTEQKLTIETEKMEVEDGAPKPSEKDSSSAGTTEEQGTGSPQLSKVSTCENNPNIVEQSDNAEKKTEEKQTEKMETESSEPVIAKPDDEKPHVEEDTSPITITEIEDITDKNAIGDAEEIIGDVEPIVEEPTSASEIEELQNVGDVLEKECNEILSKVQDVTNLENIPAKPLLNPIAEETMETENTDSNDIVDRILDTELELEMKQCTDIDLNTVSEISEENKKERIEENGVRLNKAEVKEMAEEPVEKEKTKEKTEESKPETKVEETNGEEEKKQNGVNKEESKENTEKAEENEKKEDVISETKEDATSEKKENPTSEKKENPTSEKKENSTSEKKENPTSEKKENVTSEKKEVPLATESKTPELNGKNNGTAAVNGDANEELSSRLSVENGKEINGTKGEAVEENGNGGSKVEPEVPEIKVKTVANATEETRNDPPIETTVEA